MPRKEKLDLASKISLVRRYLAGEISVTAAAREAGVAHKTVRRWIARYEVEGVEGFCRGNGIGCTAQNRKCE